ncbi:MAG: host attachment protein [Pseudomonadota bacterium]
MKPDWILIANASHARLLEHRPGKPLTLLQTFEHPQSRRKAGELGTTKAGHEFGASGFAGAAYYSRVNAKDKEQIRFARELAEMLEQEARQNTFQAVSLFASSPFLGELKQELGDMTAQLLTTACDIDLTRVGLVELAPRIAEATAR